MNQESDVLRRAADELAIRNLAGGFSDAVNRRDFEEFRSLWAPDGTWEILDPLPAKATGVDAIVELLKQLLTGRDLFVQMTHDGVVHVHGDQAIGRWTEEEVGRGPGPNFYHNYALYEDEFIRVDGTWKFLNRTYRYLYLDSEAIKGAAFEPKDHPNAKRHDSGITEGGKK